MYVVAKVDEEICNGCRMCVQTCPEPNAIKLIMEGKKAKKAVIIESRCKGCGLCEVKCPDNAISLITTILSAA